MNIQNHADTNTYGPTAVCVQSSDTSHCVEYKDETSLVKSITIESTSLTAKWVR